MPNRSAAFVELRFFWLSTVLDAHAWFLGGGMPKESAAVEGVLYFLLIGVVLLVLLATLIFDFW